MEFVEEYHQETQRSFPIPELEFQAGEEIEDFLERKRPEVIRAMAVASTLLVEFGAESIPCFAIKDTDMVFNVHREEAAHTIDRCIEYFTEIEDYEKCIKLTELKSRL